MASPRTGYGLPARPSDGYRPARRLQGTASPGGIPRPVNREGKRDPDIPKIWQQSLSQQRTTNRALQGSIRQPSIPQPSSKSNPDRQSRSWGSTSTAASGASRSHTQNGSGSSSSSRSYDDALKPPSNTLRRKKSSLSRARNESRNDSASTSSSSSSRLPRGSVDHSQGSQFDRGITESPAEMRSLDTAAVQKVSARSPVIYPELDRYRHHDQNSQRIEEPTSLYVPFRLATHDLPPPTPASLILSGSSSQVSGFSGSPSTRLSESPGPGPYSRDTTPTSMSSQSPSITAPSRITPPTWTRQTSPAITRPPVTRRRAGSIPNEVDSISADPHGLAAVRESLTSSSSNSTVRDGDRNAKRGVKEKPKILPPPPPSPPPRKSSQKFRKVKEDKIGPVQAPKPNKPTKDGSGPKTSSPTKASKVTSSSPPKTLPPTRPSRDGTADIKSQLLSPVPVIRSNLSSASRPERRGSEPTVPSVLQKSSASLSQGKKNSSTSNLPATKDTSSVSKTSTERKKPATGDAAKSSQGASPKIGTSFNSRFNFFGRRKTSVDTSPVEKGSGSKKSTRKGPAAGTGHEGYGRVGAAGRRSSSSSNFARGSLEMSQESLANGDPFLADRVNPVVIVGGEVVENRNASFEISRTESNLSIPYGRPSTDSKAPSEISQASSNVSRSALWPSAIPRDRPSLRRPSDSSDSEGPVMRPTIALRRSVQRLRSSPDDPLRLPQPINTGGVVPSPLTSFDTSIMSDESVIELQHEVSRPSNNPHPAPKKLKKRAPSPRKWNLFGRSQSRPEPKQQEEQVAATVKAVEKRPVPFYAMIDAAEQDENDVMDVQDVLRFADVYAQPSNIPPAVHDEVIGHRSPETSQSSVNLSGQSIAFTTQMQPNAPSTQLPAAQAPKNILSSGRPSRLPQVGRIPHVVSKRVERPSPKSFSRPFRASLQLSVPEPQPYDMASIAKGPSPPRPSSPERDDVSLSVLEAAGEIGQSRIASPRASPPKLSLDTSQTEKEFISFSPRKYSTGTSSSSGTATGSFAAATAVIPHPDDPPAEDEVWDEYDDLLGDDNVKAPQSATSSKGIPFHLETYHTKLGKEDVIESPTIVTNSRKVSTISKAPTHSTSYSADMTERIRIAFQPHQSQQFTAPEDAAAVKRPTSLDSSNVMAVRSQSRQSSSSSKARYSDCSSCSSEDTSPLAQVNLRVGSMTVSKWLTFGHVLFSDIRHELVPVKESLNRQSILVIDGLGNDDWSFYAAETYPSATFFNLSPRAPPPADLRSAVANFPLSPPNHHQIQYKSQLDKFPYAPQSFTSVVYRFPAAVPESHYRNVISEARRVLKPGGFIELAILDVDLNNMGNTGRRAVRNLKERIHGETPDIRLGSTADLIVRLLGNTGFSSIKAARVGVPVASSISRSGSNRTRDRSSAEKKKERPSLAEMMSDNSDMADEGITKMVAKVGRWWYSRCYEIATGPSAKSIWDDKALLSECEEYGTSLKLMVCCARAPDRITSL